MTSRRMLTASIAALLGAGPGAAQTEESPLALAAKNRDTAAVLSLLSEGVADVVATDNETMTALHWAAYWNDLEAVEALLDAGARANVSNRYGVTPLHEAVTLGSEAVTRRLLDAGADPNAGYGAGETPVMIAARTGHVDTLALLLDHGGEINAAEEWRGQTPLMWAAIEGHAEAARFLIDRGADVNARSALLDFEQIETSAAGALVDRPTGELTPLYFAARQGHDAVGEVLLDSGADVNPGEVIYGFTPLQVAVINGHWDFAAMLIERGADVDDGSLYTAVETRNTPAYTNRPAPPLRDRVLGDMDIVRMLLDGGADPDQVYTKRIPPRQAQGEVNVPPGATPMLRAAFSTDMEIMRLLMEYGATPATTAADGSSPLMVMAGLRARGRYDNAAGPRDPMRLEAVRMFWEAGAPVDGVHTPTGNTALHYAARNGAQDIVRFLTAAGASLHQANNDGQTPSDMFRSRALSLAP